MINFDNFFHLFDIRGIYPQEVNGRLAYLLGLGLGKYFDPGEICLAGDNRSSTLDLLLGLYTGLKEAGLTVHYLGQVPTPVFYYSVAKFDKFAGGIIVTASHIDSGQNGFKFVGPKALPFNEAQILDLKDTVRKLFSSNSISEKPLSQLPPPDSAIYVEYIKTLSAKFANLNYPRGKVILDCGQTIAASLVKQVFSRLPLNCEILDTPRGLNPLDDLSRVNLARRIVEEKAILGVIWDGDADRVLFLDRYGELISPSYILGIIGKNYQKIAVDTRAGLAALTAPHIIVPSWAQNLKYAMQDNQTIGFAGETSGHLIFREWYSIDDGIFAALKFLELTSNLDLDEEIKRLKGSYHEIEEANFPREKNYTVALDNLADYYRERSYSVSVVDGVTVTGEDFKFNLRPSLTEPYMRLNLEAASEEKIAAVVKEIKEVISAHGEK